MRNRTILIAAALLLALGAVAHAGVIQTAPGDFAVLAGSTLGTGTGVRIGGMAGAAGNVWLGNDVDIRGAGTGIPEPATLAFLAMGSAGFLLRRRR